MRGASALQDLLQGSPDAGLRLFVVWEPVIWSDLTAPTSGVLARVLDRRAAQFWDPDRRVSEGLLLNMPADPRAEPRDPVEAGDVVWDCVAIYPPGVRWEGGPPEPSYIDCPVVRVIDEVARRLSSSGSPGR